MDVDCSDCCQALFNAMLRDFGVKGVRVQEVVSLDEEMMAFLQYGVPGLRSLFFFFFFHVLPLFAFFIDSGSEQQTRLWLDFPISLARR